MDTVSAITIALENTTTHSLLTKTKTSEKKMGTTQSPKNGVKCPEMESALLMGAITPSKAKAYAISTMPG
ncbi:hypothetical protein [Sporosarcina globispora]|uniref:hypothetical protein n=1 Tax=Sporosarcina globispora TaxID=1459 RepID=UPI00128F0461|nr:hypothetical protein [Sporosarcina globispora]